MGSGEGRNEGEMVVPLSPTANLKRGVAVIAFEMEHCEWHSRIANAIHTGPIPPGSYWQAKRDLGICTVLHLQDGASMGLGWAPRKSQVRGLVCSGNAAQEEHMWVQTAL